MEIDKLIDFIKSKPNVVFSRGEIIDFIANNNDEWIMVLKALLIKNTKKYIAWNYLLEKLNFMKRHPEAPYTFLDYQGAYIFARLRQD